MLRFRNTRLAGPSRLIAPPVSVSTFTTPPPSSRFRSDHPAQPSSNTQIHRSRPSRPMLISFAGTRSFSSTSHTLANFPFKLHDIGEGIAEVELVKWYVKPGDKVEEFDVLCEVQSDKSTVELTSPTVGIVKRLGADEGVVVRVGEVICDIEMEGQGGDQALPVQEQEREESVTETPQRNATDTATSSPPPPASPTPPAEKQSNEEKEVDDQSLFQSRDSLLDTAPGAQFSGEAAMLPSPPPRTPHSMTSSSASASKTAGQLDEPRRREWSELRKIVKASPAIRTLAARMGVDLPLIKGTGEGGRVIKEDILAFADPSSSSPIGVEEEVVEVDTKREEIPLTTKVEFGRTRKVMYRAMGDMGQVPHFGYSHTLNLTPLIPYIQSLSLASSHSGPVTEKEKKPYLANDMPSSLVRNPLPQSEKQVDKTTLLSFLIKGLLLAMEEHPIMRSRVKFTPGKEGERWLEIARDGTIAVAVSDPKFGLLTPSLPPLPPSSSLSNITSHLSSLRRNASKPTSPGSITISSVGALGESRGAMPVLPPGGGVAIAAVGRAAWGMEWSAFSKSGLGSGSIGGRKQKGVFDYTPQEVEKGGMEAVLRCPVGWSGDHRVLEGAELIAFTETWKKYIEEPWRWLKVDG